LSNNISSQISINRTVKLNGGSYPRQLAAYSERCHFWFIQSA